MLSAIQAQPYIDIVQLKYTHSPGAGLWRQKNQRNYFEYYSAAFNLPFVSKKDSSIILLSPYLERWDIGFTGAVGNYNDLPNHLDGLVLPVTYIRPVSENWSITLSAIPRWNGDSNAFFKNSFQIGGAVIAAYKATLNLTVKLGLYYNSEFSGAFFMPLLGLDWRIDKHNNLFGLLPGNLVFEHKITRRFYCGLNFRAITNTYNAGSIIASTTSGLETNSRYLRIDDNQLNAFADVYILKHLVLTLEAGHSILRKMRVGLKNPEVKYYYQEPVNDDYLLKASLNYRIRFR
jgi:Domain of unknown function (DUF6268)